MSIRHLHLKLTLKRNILDISETLDILVLIPHSPVEIKLALRGILQT